MTMTLARRSSIAGIALLLATAALVYSRARVNAPPSVKVVTPTATYCGVLSVSDAGQIQLTGHDGTTHLIPITEMTSISPNADC